MRIDLNADVGESFGPWVLGQDPALMPIITSANIACGFHAGDPAVMRRTVRLAKGNGVAVGAHPGFQDLASFGRRELPTTAQQVEDLVAYQVGALLGVAATEGVSLRHVKPHGALYNVAARDASIAAAIARAVAAIDRALIVVGLPDSHLIHEAARGGLQTAAEGFADRAYQASGSLVPRAQPGAVIEDVDTVVERVTRMVVEREVTAIDGTVIRLDIDTVCVHGDTPGAAHLAGRIRDALREAGVTICRLTPRA